MSYPVYYVPSGDVLPVMFSSYAGATGASVTLTGLAVTDIEIYKDGGVTQRASDAGYTLLDTDGIDFDAITGIHGFSIDTGDNTDAGFYTVGAWFHVVVSAVTIDSQTVNFIACAFRLMPAESVAGKPKVDVDAWLGTAAATPTVAGVPEVDVTHWIGTAAATPTVAGVPEVDVTHFNGTAGTFASGRPEVNTSHIAGSAVSTAAAQIGVNVVNAGGTAWASGSLTSGVFAAGAINAAAIAADAITAAKVADGTIDANTFAAGAINAAAIADSAIDRATFAADTGLQSIRSNTAQAGGATSITLDASASATDDLYKNSVIYLTGGTGVGQYRICTAYNGTTKVATTTPAWTTNPDVTSTFAILPEGTVNLAAILATAVSTTSAQLGVNVVNAAGTAWGSGAITSGVFAAGAIDAAAIAANAIGASELAADAVAEIADAVWDEDIVAAHGTADTAGLFLKDVEAAVDTEVAAIKAKTDQLTFTTANQVDATTVTVSTGAIGTGDIATAALNEIADAILDRNMATGTDSGSSTVRTVRQALRALRNKVAIAAGTATINKEDDATASWTAAVGTTAGDPISSVDPAGP